MIKIKHVLLSPGSLNKYIFFPMSFFFLHLAVLYGSQRSGGLFPVVGPLHTRCHKVESTCSRNTTAMVESKQSEPATSPITILYSKLCLSIWDRHISGSMLVHPILHYTIYSAMFINKGPTHIWEYASAPYTTLYYIQCHVY